MNVLFKNRYFRRDCACETWAPKSLAQQLPDKLWCFDYKKDITGIDIIYKLCELGDLRNLKKTRKSTNNQTLNIRFYLSRENNGCRILKYRETNSYIFTYTDIELMVSSYYGHLPMVQYLASQGADIHVDNDEPIRFAASSGHLPVVQYLVEKGAHMHAINMALQMSVNNGHLPVVQYLLEQGANIHADDNEALRLSAENGHIPIIRYMIEYTGLNIRHHSRSLLTIAAKKGNIPMIQYLMQQGCSLNDNDNRQYFSNDMFALFDILLKKVLINQ